MYDSTQSPYFEVVTISDRKESPRERPLVSAMFVWAAVTALLWVLPGGGSNCHDIVLCQSHVTLDLGDLTEIAKDWQVESAGMTLSPDEGQVAVVLMSPEMGMHRLAVFSTTTGDMLFRLENDGANFFANPVYSNDGSRIAAATGIYEDEFLDSGEVTIWDTATSTIQNELWSWTNDRGEELTDIQYLWQFCRKDMGFSNDGLYLACDSDTQLVAASMTDSGDLPSGDLPSGDLPRAYEYEPGFNTVPTGYRFTSGRVVYDPELSRTATVQFVNRSSAAVQVAPIHRRSVAVLQIGHPGWQGTSVALSGDSTLALATRGWGGSFTDQLLPRFTRPAGDLTVVSVEEGVLVESFNLPVRPATARFSPSGESFGVLATDLSFWLFDTPQPTT